MKRREFLRSMAAAAAAGLPLPLHSSDAPKPAAGGGEALPRRALGKTGAEVPVLALGGVIGMQRAPEKDFDPAAIAEAALDLGVAYFDTAPGYAKGQSETNYGQVLARRRKEVFLASKTGDRSHDGTLRSIEESLKRLRTDHLDLLQIHGVGANEKPEEWGKPGGVYAALRKLRDQKVIRFLGVTGHESAEMLRRAIEMYEFDTILTTLNPVTRRRPYRDELLPKAKEKGMGIIAMKVMGGGNGCLAAGNPLRKLIFPYHDETSHQVEAARLLRYSLSLPISVAVVGVASVEQLKANVDVVRDLKPLTAAERQELEKAMA